MRPAALAAALALAHHPLCQWFAADWVRIGKARVCQGCLATWPLALLSAWLALAAWQAGADPMALAAAGLALGLPHLASYAHRASRAVRVAAKAVGGIGLGLAGAGWLLMPWGWWTWAGPAAFALASLALQALRLRSILRTCDACPWARDWDRCPGFQAGRAGQDVGAPGAGTPPAAAIPGLPP